MRRRDFITLVGGTAAAWPLTARAQQSGEMRRVGLLMGYSEGDPEGQANLAAFRQGLQKLGWIEGRNIRIDTRWGGADPDKARIFAKELVGMKPDVIVPNTNLMTAILQPETHTIPIVFVFVGDPVGSGYVASLARPGGNITGFSALDPAIGGKWLELLKEIAPRVNRAAYLFNPATTPYRDIYVNPLKVAAASLGLEAIAAPVLDGSELESVVAAQANEPNSSLIVMPDGFMNVHRAEIIALSARYRLPTVCAWHFFAELGCLLSYGSEQRDHFQLAATYVDRILKGEKPADLPVQAPTKFELVINLKTAKALGLDVSRQLQQIADEVIE